MRREGFFAALMNRQELADLAEKKSSNLEFILSIMKVSRKSLLFLIVTVVFSVAFLSNNAGIAQTSKPLSADLMQHIDQDKFVEFRAINELPDGVKAHFLKTAGLTEISKMFANPGDDWEAGCVRTKNGPPTRHFLLGAKSKTLCVIYYETGGFALVDSIEMYKLNGAESERVWSSSMFREHPKTMEQLLKTVKERVKG